MLQDHAHYVATLREAGADVTELSALEAWPDSVFVEDVALCLPEGAILMRPGAPSRAGEVAEMAPVLRDVYEQLFAIEGPGFIEGGDILTTSKEILVGRSARTDAAGIAELAQIVARWDYPVRGAWTPPVVSTATASFIPAKVKRQPPIRFASTTSC
jgi:dimethylargininase